MNLQDQTIISKLLKEKNKYDEVSEINQNQINETKEVLSFLNIQIPNNVILSKSLNLNLLRNAMCEKPGHIKTDTKKVNYKSKINRKNFQNIVDFKLWENIPNSTNLLNSKEIKKTNIQKNYNYKTDKKVDNVDENQMKFKNNNLKNDEEEVERPNYGKKPAANKPPGGYMSYQPSLKRKE